MTRFIQLIATFAASLALAMIMVSANAQKAPSASTAPAKTQPKGGGKQLHRLIIQVDTNESAAMNLALNNAANVDQYYSDRGEPVEIEIITFGPGLHMLREDTSPVKDRIKSLTENRPSVQFKACGNTQENMSKL